MAEGSHPAGDASDPQYWWWPAATDASVQKVGSPQGGNTGAVGTPELPTGSG